MANENIKSVFTTLPQRSMSSLLPPFGALAVINLLCRAGYKDTFLNNIDVLRSSRKMLKKKMPVVIIPHLFICLIQINTSWIACIPVN